MRRCAWSFVVLGLIRPVAAGSQQTPMTFSVSAEAVFEEVQRQADAREPDLPRAVLKDLKARGPTC